MQKGRVAGLLAAMLFTAGCGRSAAPCEEKLRFARLSPDGLHVLVIYSEACDLGLSTSYANIASVREIAEWKAHPHGFPPQSAFIGVDAGGDSMSGTSNWIDNRTVLITLDRKGYEKKINDKVLGIGYRMAYPVPASN